MNSNDAAVFLTRCFFPFYSILLLKFHFYFISFIFSCTSDFGLYTSNWSVYENDQHTTCSMYGTTRMRSTNSQMNISNHWIKWFANSKHQNSYSSTLWNSVLGTRHTALGTWHLFASIYSLFLLVSICLAENRRKIICFFFRYDIKFVNYWTELTELRYVRCSVL